MSSGEVTLAVITHLGLIAGSLWALFGHGAEKIYDGKDGRPGWPAYVMSRKAYIMQSKVVAVLILLFVVFFWAMMTFGTVVSP